MLKMLFYPCETARMDRYIRLWDTTSCGTRKRYAVTPRRPPVLSHNVRDETHANSSFRDGALTGY